MVGGLYANGSVLARYTQGLGVDEPLAEYLSGIPYYYQADGLGSITSLSSTSGSVADTYTYDSFGSLTASTVNVWNSFSYIGREYDSQTGLYYYRARYYDYYRARYYDPQSGRYLSEDPWDADPMYDDSNLYKYVGNNPVNFVDPLGLYTVKPGVPAPSPALDKLLTCMDGCVGAQSSRMSPRDDLLPRALAGVAIRVRAWSSSHLVKTRAARTHAQSGIIDQDNDRQLQ